MQEIKVQEYWMKSDTQPAFKYSKAVIEHHAKSFSIAAKFLPEKKRWATYAVYAFCRYADNIMDKPRERMIEEISDELDMLQDEIYKAYEYGESEHPSVCAFIAAANEYKIPIEYAIDLIKGVMMDKNLKRYDDFDQLYLFCYRVAAVVGLMMTYVLGFSKEETLVYAEKLGIAMQLTNILRDVGEDADMGRIYLPQDEMERFGVSDDDILNKRFTKNVKALIKFQVDRARNYYREAEPGIPQLDRDAQFAIYAASRIYGGILNKLVERDYNPFLGRVFVPKSQKVQILLSEFFKRKLFFVNA